MKPIILAAVALALAGAPCATADARTAVVHVPCLDKAANGHTLLDITTLPAWATAKFLHASEQDGLGLHGRYPSITILFMRRLRDEEAVGLTPDGRNRICTVRVSG